MKDKEKLPRIDRNIEMSLFHVYEHVLYSSYLKDFPFPLCDMYCFYLLIEKYITLKTSIPNGFQMAQHVILYIEQYYPKVREQLRWLAFARLQKKDIVADALFVINRLDYLLAGEN